MCSMTPIFAQNEKSKVYMHPKTHTSFYVYAILFCVAILLTSFGDEQNWLRVQARMKRASSRVQTLSHQSGEYESLYWDIRDHFYDSSLQSKRRKAKHATQGPLLIARRHFLSILVLLRPTFWEQEPQSSNSSKYGQNNRLQCFDPFCLSNGPNSKREDSTTRPA